jgi:hypothetical protein
MFWAIVMAVVLSWVLCLSSEFEFSAYSSLFTHRAYCSALSVWHPNRLGHLYWPSRNDLCVVRANNGVSRRSLCRKGQCTLTWAKVKCAKVVNRKELQWWQGPVMWLLEALAAWGHVHPHSTNHLVYTCHIPNIFLVYDNKMSYMRYMLGIY